MTSKNAISISGKGGHCWWCLYDSDLRDMASYLGRVGDTIADFCVGRFCSFECCYAFVALHDFPNETTAMIHKHYRETVSESGTLKRAPFPFVLEPYYGGGLSYSEFRKSYHVLQNGPLHSAVNTTNKYIDVKMEVHEKRKRKIEALLA